MNLPHCRATEHHGKGECVYSGPNHAFALMTHSPFRLTPLIDLVDLDRANSGRDAMTTTQAAALMDKWKQRVAPRPCVHHNLELERNDSGSFTGHYQCSVCGESVAIKHQ